MKDYVASLDILRVFGAIMIVLFHVGQVFMYVVTYAENLKVIVDWFWMFVPLFFCLAGFVLYSKYANGLETRDSVRKYLIRRFLRIAPLFYVILVCYAVVRAAGIPANFSPYPESWEQYALTATLLFNLFPTANDSLVLAGWSVSTLFIFYLCLPVLVVIIRKWWHALVGLLGALFFGSWYLTAMEGIGLSVFFPTRSFFTHFTFFMLGICAVFVVRAVPQWRYRRWGIGVGVLTFGAVLLWMVIWESGWYATFVQVPYIDLPFYTWGLAFVCLIIGVALCPGRVLGNRMVRFLSDRSYGIYLIHPLMALLLYTYGIYYDLYLWVGADLAFVLGFLLTFGCAVGLASASYWGLEQPILRRAR